MPSDEAPPDIDPSTPSVARMYDFYLGGKDNYIADRMACDRLDNIVPGTRGLAINNRRYLQRAVRVLADEYGIRQFIDHGTGLPTQDNVHQVAQGVAPDSRVVYVDNAPDVLIHGRKILAENDRTAMIEADMRDTDSIIRHPDTVRLIDFDQPVAALFVSVLHCIPDRDDPLGLVRGLMQRLPSGSCLVISHLVADDDDLRRRLTQIMLENTRGNWGRVRSRADVVPYFEGLNVLAPGLGNITDWRPDGRSREQTRNWIEFGGVARKP